MNAQSNLGKENGAKPAAPTLLDQEPPRDDMEAPLDQELRTPLNAIMDLTKQLESQCDNDCMTDNVKKILKAAHDSLDIINRQVARRDERDNGHQAPPAAVISQCDVLHIEDDSTSFASVKLLLGSKRKLKVLRAINGESGIISAQANAPRLILLDLDLPDIHGSEVLQRLQKESVTAGTPVVVISGDTTPSQIERLLVLGARNYLTKPFNPQVFLAVVDGILEGDASPIESRRTAEPIVPFSAARQGRLR